MDLKWISVNEDLPKRNYDKIFAIDMEDRENILSVNYSVDNKRFYIDTEGGIKRINLYVTHWLTSSDPNLKWTSTSEKLPPTNSLVLANINHFLTLVCRYNAQSNTFFHYHNYDLLPIVVDKYLPIPPFPEKQEEGSDCLKLATNKWHLFHPESCHPEDEDNVLVYNDVTGFFPILAYYNEEHKVFFSLFPMHHFPLTVTHFLRIPESPKIRGSVAMDMKNCDMCGSKIHDGKCSCGIWKTKEEMKDCPIKQSLEKFHEMKKFTLSGDAPHLGCAVIYFRGDYNDCIKVQKFIYALKNRPYYNHGTFGYNELD